MRTEVLQQAIATYGVKAQLNMVIEECAELIKAINKADRSGIVSRLGVQVPDKYSPDKHIEAYNNLCSEVADVKIMLAQLEMILCKERIDISVDRKVQRLEDRLNKAV